MKYIMSKRNRKLLKHGLLILLALLTLLLFFIPMPVFSTDVRLMENITNDANKVMSEDIHQFCLAVASDMT
jgi:uncharacterized protein YpmS